MDNHAYIHDELHLNGKEKNGGINGAMNTNQKYEDVKKITIEEEDVWKVTSLKQDFVPWKELDKKAKIKRAVGYFIKIVLVLGFLYLFICSLDFLSSAFRLLGGEAAGNVFKRNDIMSNPVAGLMMGVLVTVLVQSSSTSTSIIVSMVGADLLDIKTAIPIVMGANIGTSVTNTIVAIGQINDEGEFRRAFAGATVHDMFNWLCVIVLLPLEVATDYLYHLSDKIVGSLHLSTDENADKEILKVITKPFTEKIIKVNKDAIKNIAKDVETKYDYEKTVLKICCDKPTNDKCCNSAFKSFSEKNLITYGSSQKDNFCSQGLSECAPPTYSDGSKGLCQTLPWGIEKSKKAIEAIDCDILSSKTNITGLDNCCKQDLWSYMNLHTSRNWTTACGEIQSSCAPSSKVTDFMDVCTSSVRKQSMVEQFDCFKWTTGVINNTCQDTCDYLFRDLYPNLNDKEIGAILLVIALLILCICLVAIVKLLHSILQGPMATLIKKFVNADFPGYAKHLTGYLAILIGAGLTFIVQSSSIFTSTLTPLVGIGVIELDRMYPLTLGSNIGTTTTAILAALASDAEHLRATLQIAFCHLFFNISGILIFYPIPYMRFPIPLAKYLGNITATYRWYAIVYIVLMFFAIPASIFALSIPGWYVLLGVAGPFVLIAILVIIVNIIQSKKPALLPPKFRNWKWLPKPLRSLEPYDRVMKKVFFCARFQEDGSAKHTHLHPQGHDHISNTKL